MPPSKKPGSRSRVPVETIRHKKDQRVNIPTRELRDFVTADETSPKTKAFEGLLYARDPSLDPQLVWKGKDEQDQRPLEVPVVPIYIQEKVHPQAIVENVREEARRTAGGQGTLDLFSDFNGIRFEELVDFYHHKQNWSNRMILGDSLVVMTSLAEKEGLKGQVQTIYLDPPYGIKFGSNWQVSTRKRDVKDGKVEDLTRQPEQVRAFRDTWELGIHSYLSYLRDRLVVARELLVDTGSVFVQIGDENVHLVRSLVDEVFGSDNFCGLITFKKTSGTGSYAGRTTVLSAINDHIVWYAKDRPSVKYRQLYREKEIGGVAGGQYTWVEDPTGERRRAGDKELLAPAPGVRVFRPGEITSQTVRVNQSTVFPVDVDGGAFLPAGTRGWSTNVDGMRRLRAANRLLPIGRTLTYVRYLLDFAAFPTNNLWDDTVTSGFSDPKTYVVQTNPKVIERCVLMTTDPGDLVLDPTCGSGTTAYVAEQWGRRWITIDTSRVALALARTRLMAARFPYYVLVDSPEGVLKEAETTGTALPAARPRTEADVKRGFVYRRVPHITLKSIANNDEIDEIWERFQNEMEPLREKLNATLKMSWADWEIPRETGAEWSKEARKLHESWWTLRRERQKEIDASIQRRATPELLFDDPFEDSKRVRVTGPFTAESLSPHRVLDADAELPASERAAMIDPARPDFASMILANLKKAGVQNTRRAERLEFERLDPWAGVWIQAAGEFTEKGGATKRVAVSIGPEHGTVGSEQVKEAAKEALQGAGFDLLVVCGFAFDAHAGETAQEFMSKGEGQARETVSEMSERRFAVAEATRQFGKLPVLLARMNPDLSMGDEVLKKTGAGNLFMVFGEPDLEVSRDADGRVVVEIRGVDVYDPTTGQIRSSSTNDIACWFLDTDYNGESFFVRHAYFTGGDEPYDKLKRALRAEVDEAAWAALYRTTSLPFDPPRSGKIAVKVINHYGDEVLEVRPIGEAATRRVR
jgi:adenine-specific DNA-methyltransferase